MFNSFPQPRPDSGGSNIKSIQSGVSDLASVATLNIPISAVDLTKSIVEITLNGNALNAASLLVSAELTTSTNLLLTRGVNDANSATVSWTVTEYNNVKSLQKGIFTSAAVSSVQNITVSNVNVSKSKLACSYHTANTTTNAGAVNVRSALTTPTNIAILSITVIYIFKYQLIEFN